MTSTFEDLEGADAAIEAIIENEAAKRDIFRATRRAAARRAVPRVEHVVGADHEARRRDDQAPDRVLGMHFFNPVPVLPLVEVVTSIMTEPETVESVRAFAEGTLGKQCIDSQDRAGFVVNALLIPYLLSAIRMYESGLRLQGGHRPGHGARAARTRWGRCALSRPDRAGHAAGGDESLYDEFRDPASVAPAVLNRMVEAGLLGRKTGRGFYDYSK